MTMEQRKRLQNFSSIIPQRLIIALMGFLSTILVFMIRNSLDMAIVQMANTSLTVEDEIACRFEDNENATQTYPFDWNASTQASLLGAFFGGYIMTQFFGGMLSEFLGGKIILGISMLIGSLCTFSAPIVLSFADSTGFYILRLITGMAFGLSIPSLMVLISRWVPKDERARFGAVIYGGTYIGHVIASHLVDFILSVGGWHIVFYTFGVIGFIWCIVWYFLCYSTPNDHPFISLSEKKYLNENVNTLIRTNKYPMDGLPWKAFLRCGAYWTTVAAFIGHEWGFQTVVTYIPKYISEFYGYNLTSGTVIYSVGFLVMWIASLIFAVICDCSVKKGWNSIVNARKIYTTIGIFGPAVCVSIVGFSGDLWQAVLIFFLAVVSLGAFHSGAWINFLDLIPNYAGTMIGTADNIAINIARLVSIAFNSIVSTSTLLQFRISFLTFAAVMVLTLVIYVIFAKAEQVWWDDVRLLGYPSDWKHGYLTTTADIIVGEDANKRCTCQQNREEVA